MDMDEMVEDFKMLADKTRLTILTLLKQKELCVCEIVDILNMSQPRISQHLRKLKSARLVSVKKKGQWVYYSLNLTNKSHIEAVLQFVPSHEITDKMLGDCCNDQPTLIQITSIKSKSYQ
jgi:ArsR family transcriptional regulator